jgi:hypothetical protein
MREFPPRLPFQPIFYPVVNEAYAAEIARRWNAQQDQAGFVTAFEVEDAHVLRYTLHRVGAEQHVELWVPAPELKGFNQSIQGLIQVTAAYYGPAYRPPVGDSPVDRYLVGLYEASLLKEAASGV